MVCLLQDVTLLEISGLETVKANKDANADRRSAVNSTIVVGIDPLLVAKPLPLKISNVRGCPIRQKMYRVLSANQRYTS